MRIMSLAVFGSMVALATGSLLAQDTDPVPQRRTKSNKAVSKVEGAADQAAARDANRWRYRYYNSRWWYYHADGHWSYWNGSAWASYRRPASVQRSGSQTRPYSAYDAFDSGRRTAGTIQREKNATRAAELEWLESRQAGTIQREKNDTRSSSFESFGVRPPGTIQAEKNNPRAP